MKLIIDRYLQAGLKSNPFAAEINHDLHGELFVDRDLSDPPVTGSPTLVQVIGDKGAGKTSQVMAWRERAPGPYHYVVPRPYRERWTAPPIAPVVYGDEIDRMPIPLRRRWFRQSAQQGSTIVAGTHVDLSSIARRAGLAVVTHKLGVADLAFMTKVFDRRFAHVAIDATRALRLTEAEVFDIHQRSGGSLRVAEVLGHEAVATRVSEFTTKGSLYS